MEINITVLEVETKWMYPINSEKFPSQGSISILQRKNGKTGFGLQTESSLLSLYPGHGVAEKLVCVGIRDFLAIGL